MKKEKSQINIENICKILYEEFGQREFTHTEARPVLANAKISDPVAFYGLANIDVIKKIKRGTFVAPDPYRLDYDYINIKFKKWKRDKLDKKKIAPIPYKRETTLFSELKANDEAYTMIKNAIKLLKSQGYKILKPLPPKELQFVEV